MTSNAFDRPLFWVGSSKKDLLVLSVPVRKFFGHALDVAQRGGQHDVAKALRGFGGEVVEDDADGTYRAVYTVRFRTAVFVLHVFEKKSKRDIATPQADMEIIRRRLKAVAVLVQQELKDEETGR